MIITGLNATVIMSGGSGLRLGSGQDSAKVIMSSGNCLKDAPGGGTQEVTNLGPNDGSGSSTATAVFRWKVAGTFQLCYRVAAGEYIRVGENITVEQLPMDTRVLERVKRAEQTAQVTNFTHIS